MPTGHLAIILHAHLPFVRHPEHEHFLEERWLQEALTECYIPLLSSFERLARDGVKGCVTLSVSPTLLAMLEDPLLLERYEQHLERSVELAEREIERTASQSAFQGLAQYYRQKLLEARRFLADADGRLSEPIARLHERGVLDIMTTTATHGLLPLLSAHSRAAAAQVEIGLEYFESVFGFRPDSFWLPECAYQPGIERLLARAGVRSFCVESHGLEHASTPPVHGLYAPVFTPSGVAVFARDRESTREVWSAKEGFPGHPDYREFYRDIGHDLPLDYVGSYLPAGVRVDTGLKYFRVTGHPEKEIYDPERARTRALAHAEEYVARRRLEMSQVAQALDIEPIVVAPFDAELFGHWWYEGPIWLEQVIRCCSVKGAFPGLTSLSDYLDCHPVHQMATPAMSSWGNRGYFEMWLNVKTDWIYPHLAEAAATLTRLATERPSVRAQPLVRRALNQCVRELLLAQASDWPFMLSNGTTQEYATQRVKNHLSRFHWLVRGIESSVVDEGKLSAIEQADLLFPDVDYRVFIERRDQSGA